MRALGPTIFEATRKHLSAECPTQIYSETELERDLGAHLEQLCNLIPPIEHRLPGKAEATTLSTILNVGWAALLTRLDQISAPAGGYGDETARRMERLHELLLKATELAEAKTLWDEQK